MMTRADGHYEIRYTEAGARKKQSTGTKDPKAAKTFRANFVKTFNAPKLSKRPTITELADAYIAYRTPLIASPGTLAYNYAPLKRHIGLLYADTVTQSVVDGYGTTRAAERLVRAGGRYGDKPVGEATISKELRMLRASLNWASSEKLIEGKPTFRIELSAGDPRTDWITKEEAVQLMGACAPHLALFLRIALSTAKRREAILSLKWDNLALHLKGHKKIDFGGDVGNKRRGVTPIVGNTKPRASSDQMESSDRIKMLVRTRG
jgi:integrase